MTGEVRDEEGHHHLDHEDGEHRDHDRLALAGRHLRDEGSQVEPGAAEEAEEAAALGGPGGLVLLHLPHATRGGGVVTTWSNGARGKGVGKGKGFVITLR